MVEVLNGGMDGGVEMLDITEGALGQVVPLQVAPGALDVVQLGGVPGQPLDREPGSRGERLGAGPAGVDRAVIEHQHHGPARPRRLWPVVAVEAGEKISEVARALGSTGDHDEFAAGMIEYAQQSRLLACARAPRWQISAALGPAMSQIGMGQSFKLVAEQEADVASRGLLLQEPEPQTGTVDRAGVLPAFEAMARPAPAIAPFRSTTLRWPGEIVSPLRTSISRASGVQRPSGPSAAGLLSTSRATASAASRLCGVRPGRGRERSAATPPVPPPLASAAPAPPVRPGAGPITALLSPASDHSTARARSASARKPERLSRSSSARPASFTINAHRRPMGTVLLACSSAEPALVRVHLKSCLANPGLGGNRMSRYLEAAALASASMLALMTASMAPGGCSTNA